MDNNNITNYNINRKSYEYTTTTPSEFHNELLRRGIVDTVQVLMSKGMSEKEAQRLLVVESTKQQQQLQQHPELTSSTTTKTNGTYNTNSSCNSNSNSNSNNNKNNNNDDDTDYDSLLDDNDGICQTYDQQRLNEIQNQTTITKIQPQLQNNNNNDTISSVRFINRTEWIKEVNDASMYGCWIIVCLTSNDTQRTGMLEETIQYHIAPMYSSPLSSSTSTGNTSNYDNENDEDDDNNKQQQQQQQQQQGIQFVMIPYNHAINNYPIEQLPTLYCYRYGTMQYEFNTTILPKPDHCTPENIELLFQQYGIL